ncbi:hypothetical protein ENSA5_32590 [Enhygromyxa salina]|uniref:Uncharacterized protein n=1 Tax=Enhygromyxa salina TaxID=215803 RepID=A0A2S9XXI0_9BACT|nr:hypothetical protein ENSA5_32590 [Enhygromyxa salina]
MSLLANIDHLAIAAGIEAVVAEGDSREYRGDHAWYPVLDGALDLFHRTGEKSIRLVVGKHTIVVQKENEETVAVVLPTGHAIAKSLRRMIRRMARKNRGPLPKPRQEMGTSTAPSTTPSAPPAVSSSPAMPHAPGKMPPSSPSVSKPSEEPATPSGTPSSDRGGSTDRGGFPNY